jgi:hypothetical protein
LQNRTQKVAVEGSLSSESRVLSGVPQGSVLGPLLFILHMTDIDVDTNYSIVSSFADDTRLLRQINSAADTDNLQCDLNVLYKWADDNNMNFNNEKFEVIRYGAKGKPPPQYTASDGSPIEEKEIIRDLGIMIKNDATFGAHIQHIVDKARKILFWILRTFDTRETAPMMTLYKALVRPHLEYCCQLWHPFKQKHIELIEGVQRTFTNQIKSVNHLDYWKRLKALKLYSLERRRERYIILYTWKILNGKVPNVNAQHQYSITIKEPVSKRRGPMCAIPPISSRAPASVKTLKDSCLLTMGPKLFNTLPKQIRTQKFDAVSSFKSQVDKFLSTIPDTPKMSGYIIDGHSNSLLHQVKNRGGGFAMAMMPQD